MARIFSLITLFFFVCYNSSAWADAVCTFKSQGTTAAAQMYMPFPAALKRGINLSHWWDNAQDHALSADEIHTIHAMGFDFVRLPISPEWLEMADQEQQDKKLSQLRCDIVSLLNEGLTIIIDMQPSPEYQAKFFKRQEEVVPHTEKLWTQMQPVLADLPSWRIYLELMNEPLVDSVSWWLMQEKIIDDIRSTFPSSTFIASPGPFNGWWDLIDRTPYKDQNVIYDFHFYEPMSFTHRGIGHGTQDKPPSPLTYPVDKTFNYDLSDPDVRKYVDQSWNRMAISVVLKNVAAWRDHYEVIVVCLEFGVYRPYIDDRSRNNWLRDTHESLETLNIPWAMWEYRGLYGLFDSQGNLDKGTMEALSLKRPAIQ